VSWYAKASPRVLQRVANALNVNSQVVRSEMYGMLQTPDGRTGVKYPHLPNQSSAPGEPPAPQRYRLANSIAVVKEATADSLYADTGPRPESFRGRAYYPGFLEYGTRKMAPRPFVRPTADKVAKMFQSQGIKVQ